MNNSTSTSPRRSQYIIVFIQNLRHSIYVTVISLLLFLFTFNPWNFWLSLKALLWTQLLHVSLQSNENSFLIHLIFTFGFVTKVIHTHFCRGNSRILLPTWTLRSIAQKGLHFLNKRSHLCHFRQVPPFFTSLFTILVLIKIESLMVILSYWLLLERLL